MRLDRNQESRGKYALLKLRKVAEYGDTEDALRVRLAIDTLNRLGIIDWGELGTESEFLVIRLKDKYATGALGIYAAVALQDGEVEYAADIFELVRRSGAFSPWCKKPD